VLFIDAIHVKIREGQFVNRPVYVVVAVTVEGERTSWGLWVSDGGEGPSFGITCCDRDQEPGYPECVHRGLRRDDGFG
jgi:hypothetical protein